MSIEEVILQEILFDKHLIRDSSHKRYLEALRIIEQMLRKGKSIKEIKAYIRSLNINHTLKETMARTAKEQAETITNQYGINADIPQSLLVLGFTINELLKSREAKIRDMLYADALSLENIIKENKSTASYIKKRAQNYKKANVDLVKTYAKGAREYIRVKVELSIATPKNPIVGYRSIAVLDSKTSSVCLGLHNTFYSANEYKSKAEVPNRPPRHPNCRSILVAEFKNTKAKKYENINDFLKNNPEDAKKILGQKKYELYKKSKLSIKNFIDLRDNRFLTNEEIEKILKNRGK